MEPPGKRRRGASCDASVEVQLASRDQLTSPLAIAEHPGNHPKKNRAKCVVRSARPKGERFRHRWCSPSG
jgi:hypothetical protein